MLLPYLFLLGNTLFNTLGNLCLKIAADSSNLGGTSIWFIIGNSLFFIGIISYTLSMKKLPLHIAYPLAQGLQVLAVTIGVAWLYSHETISFTHWIGVLLVALGIGVISLTKKAEEAETPASAKPETPSGAAPSQPAPQA